MGTSVHSQASFSTSNLSKVEQPQQSVFLVIVINLNFWGLICNLKLAYNFQVFTWGLYVL